jgi:hypothetical protein
MMAVKWTAVLVKDEPKYWEWEVYRNGELISKEGYKGRRPTEEHVIKMARRDWRYSRMQERGTAPD